MTFAWPPLDEMARFALLCLSSVFFTVDPLASIPAFLAMGAHGGEARNRTIAKRAAWTCFLVLTAFASAGSLIFKLFGITLPAFKIAGGILLFQIALEMLHSQRSETQEVAEERQEGERKEDFGITPLGVPMLAGPGAISVVMVLMGQSRMWWQSVPVFLSILVTSIASFYVLAAGARLQRRLGETGVRILMRLMGLVLAAMAVQFVLNGIADVWPGPRRLEAALSSHSQYGMMTNAGDSDLERLRAGRPLHTLGIDGLHRSGPGREHVEWYGQLHRAHPGSGGGIG
jgi:multiple antibiotic resistance protein